MDIADSSYKLHVELSRALEPYPYQETKLTSMLPTCYLVHQCHQNSSAISVTNLASVLLQVVCFSHSVYSVFEIRIATASHSIPCNGYNSKIAEGCQGQSEHSVLPRSPLTNGMLR